MTLGIHPYSPAGAVREQPVACIRCLASTWNVCATCDRCCTCTGTSRRDREIDRLPQAVEYLEQIGEERAARVILALSAAHHALHALHRDANGWCLHCSHLTGHPVAAPCPTMAAAVTPASCCRTASTR